MSAATVTEAPLPQNVSIGQLVDFTCATTNSQDIITWSTIPNIDTATTALQSLPGGGIRSVLSFTALLEHSDTTVRCIVTDPNTAAGTVKSALVLVQGESFCSGVRIFFQSDAELKNELARKARPKIFAN